MNLADELAEWTDWDVAAYRLGRSVGLFADLDWYAAKGVFWTDNEVGNGLHDVLLGLVRSGVLDRRAEPDEQFRWANP